MNKNMNGILKNKEGDLTFDVVDAKIKIFRIIKSKEMENNIVEYFPVGESITLITSNMPKNLLEQVENLIQKYCNGR
jgi:hypothetical protein